MFELDIFAAYPEPMQRLFDIEAMATGAGFLNAEPFSILLPGVSIAYGIGRGARLMADQGQEGTLKGVIVTPDSRQRILLDKGAGLAVGIVGLGVVLFASIVLASRRWRATSCTWSVPWSTRSSRGSPSRRSPRRSGPDRSVEPCLSASCG